MTIQRKKPYSHFYALLEMIVLPFILKIILFNVCTLLTLIEATTGGHGHMKYQKVEPGLRNEDLGRILLDTCCHTLQFESNDTDFLDRVYISEAFNIEPREPRSNSGPRSLGAMNTDTNNTDSSYSSSTTNGHTKSSDHTIPKDHSTFRDFLGYPFTGMSKLDNNNHVEYYHQHDPRRIKLINNATYTDKSSNTTKTIWAIYDMSTVHMKIIEILAPNYTMCPKCKRKPHFHCGVGEWNELNARFYTDNGTSEPIKDLTVQCVEDPPPQTVDPSPRPPIQTSIDDETPMDSNTPIATTAKFKIPTRTKVQSSTGYPSNHHFYKSTTFILSFVIMKMF